MEVILYRVYILDCPLLRGLSSFRVSFFEGSTVYLVVTAKYETSFQEEDEGFKLAPSNFVPTVGEEVTNYASEQTYIFRC